MVAFGSAMLSSRRPGWEAAYVDYDGLKELIVRKDPHGFHKKLRMEIEKVSLFALHRQGEIAKTLGALRLPQESPLFATVRTSHSSDGRAQALVTACPLPNDSPPADAFTQCAVELLHWQRYVCINAVGIRKIIKKFQKQHASWRDLARFQDESGRGAATSVIVTEDPHIQHLVNSAAIAAMSSSLWQACQELDPGQDVVSSRSYQHPAHAGDPEPARRNAWIRLHCTVSLIQAMRNYAKSMNESFLAFLSHKSLIGGQTLLATSDDASPQALKVFLHFEPDTLLTMDVSRMGSAWDDYRFLESSFRVNQPAAEKDWGGVDSVSLCLNLLSTLLYTINYYIVAPTANHYAILLGVDGAFGATLVGASSLMAIFAAFLYSWWYTRFSFRSALLFSSICPCVGNLLYALAISYKSIQMAMFGRLLVGLGSAEVVNRQLISACVSFDSITSASAYFVAAGASGMSIGPLMAALLDMFAGRDVNVDLDLSFTPAGGIIYDHVTSPGFVTAVLWFIQGLGLYFLFQEPNRIHSGTDEEDGLSRRSSGSDKSLDDRVKLALKSVGVKLDDGEGDEEREHDEERGALLPQKECRRKEMSSIRQIFTEMHSTWKLVFGNMGLPVTLLIFGFIELADEVLISSCSMVARRYFSWPGSTAGFIIAGLGALVLPAHFVVEKTARHFEERTIIKYSLAFIGLSLFGIINYEGLIFDFVGLAVTALEPGYEGSHNATDHTNIKVAGEDLEQMLNDQREVPYDWGAGRPVYLVFLSAIFLGTIILEGVDTSVMAKVTPPALNVAFLNCGLLATLVGTVGRVCGDSIITLSAFVDKDVFTDFLNATFLPMIVMVALGLYLVQRYYSLLL